MKVGLGKQNVIGGNLFSLKGHCGFILCEVNMGFEPFNLLALMEALSFQPDFDKGQGQSSVESRLSWGKRRKGWNVSQGDLCGG